MNKVEISTGNTHVFARIALKNKLHEGNNGYLEETLKSFLKKPSFQSNVFIAYIGVKAIGVLTIDNDCVCSIFVKPEYRNKGVGGLLITEAINRTGIPKEALRAWHGNDVSKSDSFWKKNGIATPQSGSGH